MSDARKLSSLTNFDTVSGGGGPGGNNFRTRQQTWDMDEDTRTTPSRPNQKQLPPSKWHRYSSQRTDPASWDEYKTVKPKQPRLPPPRVPKEVRKERAKQKVEDSINQEDHNDRQLLRHAWSNVDMTKGTNESMASLSPSRRASRERNMSLSISSTRAKWPDSSTGMYPVGGFKFAKGAMGTTSAISGCSSKMLWDIRGAFVDMMVSAADPQGDFSWSVSEPRAYHMLPIKLVESEDWASLSTLMCDLRFIRRKMVENGTVSILRTYNMAKVPLSAGGFYSERLQDYYDFVYEHVKMLNAAPQSIFQLGLKCSQVHVRRETHMLVQQCERIIDEWLDKHTHDGGNNKDSSLRVGKRTGSPLGRVSSVERGDRRDNPASSIMGRAEEGEDVKDVEHRKQRVSAFETMRFVNMKLKLLAMQDCGLSACLSNGHKKKLAVLIERLVQKCQSSRSRLLERGLQAYSQENRAILGLDAGDSGMGTELEQPKQFLDLAGLWDESDKVEYVTLSIYIPPKTWNNEKLREQYETNLCNQIAEAAKAPLELIDIVDIACPEKDSKKGMYGKCLIKCMELVKGLQVRVVAGKAFPMVDQVGKSDPIVSLQMRTSRARGTGGGERRAKVPLKLPRMALKTQQTIRQTTARHGELHPINPQFNETFSMLVYDLGQDLVLTCYDAENGGKTPIGEVALTIDDIFSQCHAYDDERFEKLFPLCKPGTKKQVLYRTTASDSGARTPMLQLEFCFFTHQSPNGVSPHKMANDVMSQSADPNSQLRLGCLVMGPAFHDEEGSWETVRVYLSSSYGEFHAERRYLNRYVFPALAVECLNQRLHFKWTDLSEYGASGVKDDIVKRLDSIDRCRIRGYDREGGNIDSTFLVALIGEKRGRLVDGHDIRRLEKSVAAGHKKYEWVLEAAKNGVSVQELELRWGLLNAPHASEAVVCMRSPFFEDEAFQNEVPKPVKNVFVESDMQSRTSVGHLKRNIMRTAGESVLQYMPTFMSYTELAPELKEDGNPEHVNSDKASQGVQLGGLEEFGLEVFQRLFRQITQRFPSSRAKSPVNGYIIERAIQSESVRSYVRTFHFVENMTQHETLSTLINLAEFVNEAPPVTFMVGAHGSGKSSLIAQMVYDLKAIPQLPADVLEDVDEGETQYLKKSDFTTKLRSTAMVAKLMRTSNAPRKLPTRMQAAAEAGGDKRRAFNPLADPDDDEFENDDDGEGGAGEAEVQLTNEEQTMAEGAMSTLVNKGLSAEEILFRSTRPRIVFFIKHAHHSTEEVISYLCSSLLRRQDLIPASWKRLDHLVRCRVNERPVLLNDRTTPVLFILDGLNLDERNEMQAIVSGLHGKVRAIMTIGSRGDVDGGACMARQWSGSQVLLNGPLANLERTKILERLFDRLGAKKRPHNLDTVTLRQAAGSPLYLSVVASYIGSLIAIYKRPANLKDLHKNAVDLIVYNFLPVIESVVGEEHLRIFLEVVMQEPAGRIKKDVQAILLKCGVPMNEVTLRVLTDSFRPFSDPVHREHGGVLSLNRSFLREAVRKRYSQTKMSAGVQQQLADMRIAADAQEARLNFMRFGTAAPRKEAHDDEDDEEDCQWLSDQEDQEESKVEEVEEVDKDVTKITLQFGTIVLDVDEVLFSRFSGAPDDGIGGQRSGTMDMNELVKMLRYIDLLPQHLTKTEIARAFRAANRDHGSSQSADTDVHELDFREFLDCMGRLQELYMNRLNMMGHEHEKAALLIQRRARGNMARKEVRKKKHEAEVAKQGAGATADEMTDEDIKQIVKLQSMMRMKKEKEKRQRQVMLNQASETVEKEKASKVHPAVKGKKNRTGAIGAVQRRLIELFDTIQDAYVYMDNDGNDTLTKVEFARGLQRMNIVGGNIAKLSAMVAADGLIDIVEFLRLFAWHDVRQVDRSIAQAKINRSIIIEKATERLQALKARGDEEQQDLEAIQTKADAAGRQSSGGQFKTMGQLKRQMTARELDAPFKSTKPLLSAGSMRIQGAAGAPLAKAAKEDGEKGSSGAS